MSILKSQVFHISADDTDILDFMLGDLDPNESCKITFKTWDYDDVGRYVLEFDHEITVDLDDLPRDDMRIDPPIVVGRPGIAE